ncbi:DNA damage-regulated autophagy modulator protein 1-like [Haemaphysalis longicornis]
MPLTRVELLPLSVFVLLPGTFIITYLISVLLGHVEVEFPYISDTGTYAPESCIFSQLLNICAVLMAGTVYVRYKEVEQYYRDHLSQESPQVLRMNTISLWLGWAASVGVSVVANFQETEVLYVHLAGAMVALAGATAYTWVNTVMSFRMHPLVNTRAMAFLRLFLSLVATVAFVSTAITAPMSIHRFHGKDRTKWRPEDGGYHLHVASTASEWVLVFAVDVYLLTFVKELRSICLISPKVQFLTEGVHQSCSSDVYHTQDHLEIAHAPMPSSPVSGLPDLAIVTTRAVVH